MLTMMRQVVRVYKRQKRPTRLTNEYNNIIQLLSEDRKY